MAGARTVETAPNTFVGESKIPADLVQPRRVVVVAADAADIVAANDPNNGNYIIQELAYRVTKSGTFKPGKLILKSDAQKRKIIPYEDYSEAINVAKNLNVAAEKIRAKK